VVRLRLAGPRLRLPPHRVDPQLLETLAQPLDLLRRASIVRASADTQEAPSESLKDRLPLKVLVETLDRMEAVAVALDRDAGAGAGAFDDKVDAVRSNLDLREDTVPAFVESCEDTSLEV
jgi:hypothetical protein